MSSREKRLLQLFAGMILLYAIPFELLPGVWGYLHGHNDEVQDLRHKIHRYERLLETQEQWQQRHREESVIADEVEASLIGGGTADLIGARMIGVLRELSAGVGATVKSFELPEFNASGEWLLVTQTVHFSIAGRRLYEYVKALTGSVNRFKVVSIDVRARGDQVEGSVKLVGFAHRPEGDREEEARR
ncbi:hypothetical protein [Endothiovibrio diazotrophicus]